MASIQINRGTTTEINNTPYKDGLISFDTTKMQILLDDDDERKIFGSDGTEVIANPIGEPTDTLQTIEIDSEIYRISGGHEIQNTSGTSLTQRNKMRYNGVYAHDDSSNQVTDVDVVREMTKIQKDNLNGDSINGFQYTTDENDDLPLTTDFVEAEGGISLTEKLNEIEDSIEGIIKPKITINSVSDSAITVTKGLIVIEAEEVESGVYVCNVNDYGTYTITLDNSISTTLTIDTVKEYTVNLYPLQASITIKYPDSSTCTCQKDGVTLTATSSPYTFIVSSLGTYLITVTDGVNTYTKNVTITEDGESVSYTLPTPSEAVANDIPTWLWFGNIDLNYTTIEEVLDDLDTLIVLSNNQDSVDYLVESTDWIWDIIASEDAMSAIGASDYASKKLLNNSDWVEGLFNSIYIEQVTNLYVPTMTSNTTPNGECFSDSADSSHDAYKAFDNEISSYWSINNTTSGHYLGYKFNEAVCCSAIGIFVGNGTSSSSSYVNTFKVQGSNDNTEWIDLSNVLTAEPIDGIKIFGFENSNNYLYYRILVLSSQNATLVSTLQFYGRQNGGVQDWLRSGGITDKDYITLNEILLDSTTLSTLISSQDACDYLVTAKSFISSICSDSTAMTLIGLNNYCSDILLSDNDWCNAICNSTYVESVLNTKVPTMTSNTTPSGTCFGDYTAQSQYDFFKAFDNNASTLANPQTSQKLGYQFTSAIRVFKMILKNASAGNNNLAKTFKIVGSNDGSSWTDITETLTSTNQSQGGESSYVFENATTYNRYAIMPLSIVSTSTFANIAELQFYGRQDV